MNKIIINTVTSKSKCGLRRLWRRAFLSGTKKLFWISLCLNMRVLGFQAGKTCGGFTIIGD